MDSQTNLDELEQEVIEINDDEPEFDFDITDIEDIPVETKPLPTFTIKQIALEGLLEKASSGLGSGSSDNEILKAFQIQAYPDHEGIPSLLCVATDMDLTTIAKTPSVDITSPGTVVINGRKLTQIVSSLTAEDSITVEPFDDEVTNKVRISSDDVSWVVVSERSSEYPTIPDPTEVTFSYVDRVSFAEALRKVSPAAPDDGLRPSLMVIDVTTSIMRATDAVRFHSYEILLPFDMQIPVKAVPDLLRFLRLAVDSKIGIGFSDEDLMFKVDDDILATTAVVTEFMDMKPFLSDVKKNDKYLVLDKASLLKALTRVKLSADVDTSQIVISASRSEAKVIANNKLGEECVHELLTDWEHDETKIQVNVDYLDQAINAHATPNITIAIGDDETKPIAVMGEQGVVTILRQLRL